MGNCEVNIRLELNHFGIGEYIGSDNLTLVTSCVCSSIPILISTSTTYSFPHSVILRGIIPIARVKPRHD